MYHLYCITDASRFGGYVPGDPRRCKPYAFHCGCVQADAGQQGPCESCTSKLDGKFSGLFRESRISSSNGGRAPCRIPAVAPPPFDRENRNRRSPVSSHSKIVKNAARCWVPIKWRLESCLWIWCKTNRSVEKRTASPALCCYFFATCRFDSCHSFLHTLTIGLPFVFFANHRI